MEIYEMVDKTNSKTETKPIDDDEAAKAVGGVGSRRDHEYAERMAVDPLTGRARDRRPYHGF